MKISFILKKITCFIGLVVKVTEWLVCHFLDHAIVDSTRQLVFALSESKPLPTVLTIFDAQGEKLF